MESFGVSARPHAAWTTHTSRLDNSRVCIDATRCCVAKLSCFIEPSIDFTLAAALINNELRSISDDDAASQRRHNPLIISLEEPELTSAVFLCYARSKQPSQSVMSTHTAFMCL